MLYTELQVTTNFSFLQGASHPEEIVIAAKLLGYSSIAITDTNTMAGIVRAYAEAKKQDMRLIVGCNLQLADGPSVLAYPVNKNGYAQLCGLLTMGNRRTEKGKCLLYKADLFAQLQDILLIMIPPHELDASFHFPVNFTTELLQYRQVFGEKLYLAATRSYSGSDTKVLHQLQQLSLQYHVPLVATNNVHYHHPERRQLQDVLTCIRHKTTIQQAGLLLHANAERYLKPAAEMERIFQAYPAAIGHTQDFVAACNFSLSELRYEYPEEITSAGTHPQEELERLTWQGANAHYRGQIPPKIIDAIHHELRFIAEMVYAPYFLTVHDIVRFARQRNILCQGRGSAANSAVCFCLGITAVDPNKFDLLFERFLSAARNEPPDIDVDFEHERREEVIQYIYEKYGRDRAAIVATVTQQHEKGAVRDVAKALGFSVDTTNKLSGTVMRSSGHFFDEEKLKSIGLQLKDPMVQKLMELTNAYIGFPRQLGQHTGGFVISRNKLSELCPVLNARMENRTCLEWNKDDIETLGFLKIDVLALGMLTCIRKAFNLAQEHYGQNFTLANIPQDDPAVYDMICHADTIGVFQIESRAQQSMLPRLKPRSFYDLVIEVAIVRPGPIQGDMVHPYLRRRNGEEPVSYPSKELEAILGRTLGVPLFQEQAMKIAIVGAGFTPTEADELRRSMATFKAKGMVSHFEKKLIDGMTKKGYELSYAQRVFRQLEGFGSYGFPESHAASFAQLVYVSSWLKCHYPDVFACALLNSLPMGFYEPAQIVIDAQKHGVTVLPVDVNYSAWDNLLEQKVGNYYAIRLGFRQVKGLAAADMELLLQNRDKPFTHINDLHAAGLSDAVLERLADADAFGSLQLNRRESIWQVAVKDKPTGIFVQHADAEKEVQLSLPLMEMPEQVMQDYATLSLSLKAHPVSFLQEPLQEFQVKKAAQLRQHKDGDSIAVAGLVLMRQRPGTAKGVWFVTLEDETGTINLVIFDKIFQRNKKTIIQARLLMVKGKLQIEGEVIHVIVSSAQNLNNLFAQLLHGNDAPAMPPLARSDELRHPKPPDKREMQAEKVFSEGRNFR